MAKVTQRQIVDTASALIQEQGRIDISLSTIADALGITHGALYKHFDSKQAIWEAVAEQWFHTQIIDKVTQTVVIDGATAQRDAVTVLHEWLWAFVNAKKDAYLANHDMFKLNTQYVDNNPAALQRVLQPAYRQIDELMGYHDADYQRAQAILSAFSVFTLPNLSDAWSWPDYQERFEALWRLIRAGV